MARKSAAIISISETQRQAEEWESFIVKKEKTARTFRLEIVGIRKMEAGQLEVKHFKQLVWRMSLALFFFRLVPSWK